MNITRTPIFSPTAPFVSGSPSPATAPQIIGWSLVVEMNGTRDEISAVENAIMGMVAGKSLDRGRPVIETNHVQTMPINRTKGEMQ